MPYFLQIYSLLQVSFKNDIKSLFVDFSDNYFSITTILLDALGTPISKPVAPPTLVIDRVPKFEPDTATIEVIEAEEPQAGLRSIFLKILWLRSYLRPNFL